MQMPRCNLWIFTLALPLHIRNPQISSPSTNFPLGEKTLGTSLSQGLFTQSSGQLSSKLINFFQEYLEIKKPICTQRYCIRNIGGSILLVPVTRTHWCFVLHLQIKVSVTSGKPCFCAVRGPRRLNLTPKTLHVRILKQKGTAPQAVWPWPSQRPVGSVAMSTCLHGHMGEHFFAFCSQREKKHSETKPY